MQWNTIREALSSEPKFRLKQVQKAVFVDLVDTWDAVSVLPKSMREKLAHECPLTIQAEQLASPDGGTVKALITLHDGARIETVLMRHGDGRNTVCVSTLVGCPMGCTFCATGTMGMLRKLTADEILMQVLYFARYLKPEGARVGSVVCMGMGEPFLNYEAVMEAIRALHDKDMCNIGARHISISTCGILDGIQRLAREELPVNLAISLHGSNDAVRAQLMPIARTYPIHTLLATVDEYIAQTHRKVMFEYLLVEGINDSEVHARELAVLMKRKLYMVNLISYNPTGKYTASSEECINRFRDILKKAGVEVTIRYRFGRDIEGACGQLVVQGK
jgi:23S rRNA (adenine2503-C2)-methyltransferase